MRQGTVIAILKLMIRTILVFIFLSLVSASVVGCTSIPTRMNDLRTGMSRDEAIKIMGEPDSSEGDATRERWVYKSKPFGQWLPDFYEVNLSYGEVASYNQVERHIDPAAAAIILGGMARQPMYQAPAPATYYQVPIPRQVICNTYGNMTSCQ